MTIKELAMLLRVSQALAKNLLSTSGFTLEELTDDQLTKLKELTATLSGSSKLAKKDLGEIETQHSGSIAIDDVRVSDHPNSFNDRFTQYVSTVRNTVEKESSAIVQITEDYPLILADAVHTKISNPESQARLAENSRKAGSALMEMFNNSRGR